LMMSGLTLTVPGSTLMWESAPGFGFFDGR
jgi:hypothetical protein